MAARPQPRVRDHPRVGDPPRSRFFTGRERDGGDGRVLEVGAVAEPGKGRTVKYVSLAILAASVAGGVWYLRRPPPPIEVELVRVERGEVREIVTSASSGEVKPARRVTVRAELAGTVSAVKKRRGERVAAGELVVTFTSDELEARLQQADANVEAARVAIGAAQTRLEVASRALDRARKLRKSDAISDVDLDRADTEVRALEQAVEQARAAERQSIAARRVAEVAKNRAVVRAPFPGVLQEVHAELGVQTAPGAPLFDLIDDSALRVDLPIDESDIARVFQDQEVTLRSESSPGNAILGRVSFIPPAVGRGDSGSALESAVIASKDRSLRIEVTPRDTSALRVGASVNAELLVRAQPEVLFVPSHVVLGRGVERFVYRVEGGVAKKVPFQPGLTSWERTEVKAGLALGDVLVASLNTKGLEDGSRVVPRPAPGQPTKPLDPGATGSDGAERAP